MKTQRPSFTQKITEFIKKKISYMNLFH